MCFKSLFLLLSHAYLFVLVNFLPVCFKEVDDDEDDDDDDVFYSSQSSQANSAVTSANLGHAVPFVLCDGNLCNAW